MSTPSDPATDTRTAVPSQPFVPVATMNTASSNCCVMGGCARICGAGYFRRTIIFILGICLIWLGAVVRYDPSEQLLVWENWLIHGVSVSPGGLVRVARMNELRELGLIPMILGSTCVGLTIWDWLRRGR